MTNRIDKKEYFEYWQVESTNQAHKDRKEGEDEAQDQFAKTGETTDWNLFLDKSRLWNRNIQVSKDEIDKIIFIKLNLKTDPSLLRVDIKLTGGSQISPAFVYISRLDGLKLKHLQPGNEIPLGNLIKDKLLQIITPTDPQKFLEEEKRLQNKPKTPFIALSEDTTTVIKHNTVQNGVFSLWDAKTHKIRVDVLSLYIVSTILVFLFLVGIIWLIK